MNPFDGSTEIENIIARLKTLVGGRVFESGVPDEAELDRYADGSVKPYIVGKFTTPIGALRDRRAGVGERKQQQVLGMTIVAYSGHAADIRPTTNSILDLLLDWAPNGTNATALHSMGGYSFTRSKTASAPTRFERGTHFETTINMAPGA